MTKPVSIELREKIIAAYNKGVGTQAYIAEIFDVTIRTVNRFIAKSLRKEDLTPGKQPGRSPSIDANGLKILKKIVLQEPDKTLSEYSAIFEEKTGTYISRSVMCRALQKLDLRRKKKSFYAAEQDRPDVKKKEMTSLIR